MSWGVELWDNFDGVDKHIQHEIDFLDKYMKFTKDRCNVEMEYAKQLRRLVKSYSPKKKDDDYSKFSTHKAFQSQLSEINDIAGQHEIIAETMTTEIVRVIHDFSTELKTDKKKTHQEGKQMQSQIEAAERNLEQVKRKFEKEWRESERAQLYYEKLDADSNVTKAEVEKAKSASQAKKDIVEQCKTDYASTLTRFNKDQSDHYSINMPKVFECYRIIDEKKIKKIASAMETFSTAHSKVFPIIEKCITGISQAAKAIDHELDSRLVVEKYKSGFLPPEDKEFEDFTTGNTLAPDTGSSPRNSVNLSRGQNKKGLSWLFGGKKPGNLLKMKHDEHPTTTPDGRPIISGPLSNLDFGMSMGIECKSIEELNAVDSEGSAGTTEGDVAKTSSDPPANYVNVEVGTESVEIKDPEPENKTPPNKPQRPPAPRTAPKEGDCTSIGNTEENIVKDKSIRKSFGVGKKRIRSMFNKSEKTEQVVEHKSPPPTKPPRQGRTRAASSFEPGTHSIALSDSTNNPSELEHMYTEVDLTAECADYSHLPPVQREKKLTKILDDLQQQHSKQVDGRNALLKMQEVYRKTPQLGDPNALEPQLRNTSDAIDKLQQDINMHEEWLRSCTGKINRQSGSHMTSYRANESNASPAHANNNTQSNIARTQDYHQDQSFNDEFEDEEAIDPVGSCTAMYNFEATSEGAMSMTEGDQLTVLEKDKGDGWTRVLKGNVDGYVPTSYLNIEFYNS